MDKQLKEFQDKVDSFKRELLRKELEKCTIDQQNLFDRMYKSIDNINPSKMDRAFQQICATIKKNDLNLPSPVEKE